VPRLKNDFAAHASAAADVGLDDGFGSLFIIFPSAISFSPLQPSNTKHGVKPSHPRIQEQRDAEQNGSSKNGSQITVNLIWQIWHFGYITRGLVVI
jgi:hypothetical protein